MDDEDEVIGDGLLWRYRGCVQRYMLTRMFVWVWLEGKVSVTRIEGQT